MASFTALFGESLESKDGKVSTVNALSEKKAILVYFSAHWCPPCRGFTPKLAEFYSKHAAVHGFEVVFVSSDRDEESFKEYFGEMPWLALPYENRDAKTALSKKYKVSGIPSLIVLGPDGQVITKDGRSKIMEHFDDCAGFPWKPPTLQEALGENFLCQDGSTVGREALAGKTLGLYFSAHWCPPCRGFTPVLKEFYEQYKQKDPNFEIVFVSSDKEEAGMLEYFKNDHGAYLALPYERREAKEQLSAMFGVEGIPTFVVVDADGATLNTNARGKVSAGVEAVLAEGWAPPVVGDMAAGPEACGTDINECPSLVVLCDECEADAQKAIKKALEPLAKRYADAAKQSGEDPQYIFLVATGGRVMEQLKSLTQKDAGQKISEAGKEPAWLLFDIPDNGGFYFGGAGEVTTEGIEAFLQSKEAGKETRLQLSRD